MCSGGGEESPALHAVHQEVAVRSEGRVVEGLASLGAAFVQVCVKPETKLSTSSSNKKVLVAPLQRGGYFQNFTKMRSGKLYIAHCEVL